jgi:hypothetical protein
MQNRDLGQGSTGHAGGSESGTRPVIVTSAETAECTCPDVCERDHEQD